jgi:inner membrane protein
MLLRSEDNALLMGSLFLFVLLGAVMLGTRRIDWYALGKRAPAAQSDGAEPPIAQPAT